MWYQHEIIHGIEANRQNCVTHVITVFEYRYVEMQRHREALKNYFTVKQLYDNVPQNNVNGGDKQFMWVLVTYLRRCNSRSQNMKRRKRLDLSANIHLIKTNWKRCNFQSTTTAVNKLQSNRQKWSSFAEVQPACPTLLISRTNPM